MEELRQSLSDNWFILGTFVTLVVGWVRFEFEQNVHRKALLKHDKAYSEIEKRFDEDVIKKVALQDSNIQGIRTDLEWTKKTLERLEGKLDTYLLTNK